jgi:hypothetical protein
MDKRAMEINAVSAFPEKVVHGVSHSFLQTIVDRNDIKALGTTSRQPSNPGGFPAYRQAGGGWHSPNFQTIRDKKRYCLNFQEKI